jgi:hypothetical protein
VLVSDDAASYLPSPLFREVGYTISCLCGDWRKINVILPSGGRATCVLIITALRSAACNTALTVVNQAAEAAQAAHVNIKAVHRYSNTLAGLVTTGSR